MARVGSAGLVERGENDGACSPITPFDTPVHVVRPRLPDLEGFVERLRTIWASGWLTNGGAQHLELELRLRHMLGVPSLSLFNNGTMALLTACRALSLRGEVITTPFTFPATPHVLSWLGATPVFADIDPATLTIDPDRIEPLITPQTTGILAVHVYGTPCDVDRLEAIARRHGLKLVYDAAHAFGVRVGGRGIGTFGDASAFSFHATKVFHTAEGGALACSDPELAGHAALLRNFGIRSEEEVELPGLNGKMNELQAALGLSVLDDLADEWRTRLQLSAVYRDALADLPGLAQPGPATGGRRAAVLRGSRRRRSVRLLARRAAAAAARAERLHPEVLLSALQRLSLLPSPRLRRAVFAAGGPRGGRAGAVPAAPCRRGARTGRRHRPDDSIVGRGGDRCRAARLP